MSQNHVRKNISQPADWWAAWESAARAAGMSLSAWIGKRCNSGLPRDARDALGDRVSVGKPVKADRD